MDTAALMTAVACSGQHDVFVCYNLFLKSHAPVLTAGVRPVCETDWRAAMADWAAKAESATGKEGLAKALRSNVCDVFMVPDGTLLQPGTPFARVEGPASQAVVMASMLADLCGRASSVATETKRAVREGGPPLVYDGDMPTAAFVGGADAAICLEVPEGMKRLGIEYPDIACLARDRAKALNVAIRAFGGDLLLFAHDLEALRMAAHAGIALKRNSQRLFGVWADGLSDKDVAEYREILDAPGLSDVPIYLRSRTARGDREGTGIILRPDGVGSVEATYQLGAVKTGGYWDSRPWSKSVPAGVAQVRRAELGSEGLRPIIDVVYDENIGLVDADEHEVEHQASEGSPEVRTVRGVGGGTDLLVQIVTSGQRTCFPEPIADARARASAQIADAARMFPVFARDRNAAEMERASMRP